jgi:hypothetical protein
MGLLYLYSDILQLFKLEFKYVDTGTQNSVHFTFWLRLYRYLYKINIFPLLLVSLVDGMYVPDIAPGTI